MINVKSLVRNSLFAATALGFAVLSTSANACAYCGGIKLNGPILNGPIIQGPVVQGAAAHGTQSGRVVSVILPNGVTVPVR